MAGSERLVESEQLLENEQSQMDEGKAYLGFGSRFSKAQQRIARNLKLVAFDIDGVMTDGRLYYGAEGEHLKVFNVKDGVGLKLLHSQGIDVAVISAKTSLALEKRMDDLGVTHFFPGCSNKSQCLQELARALSVASEQIAFIGDDVLDLQVLGCVGLFIAPKDAHPLVCDKAHHITESAGGMGVVREVADAILSCRMDLEQLYPLAMQSRFETDCTRKA